jgi:hypothetical protein
MKKNILIVFIISTALLLIPLIAMQFTEEVNWTILDFIVAGFLLLSTGVACSIVLKKIKKRNHQILIIIAFLAALFLIWAELAVGIFGTPFSGS